MIDHDRLYELIGERIRSIREAQTPRMSQEDLAQVLSLKRTSITNIESGQQRLTLEAIYRLCEVLAWKFPMLFLQSPTSRMPPRSRSLWAATHSNSASRPLGS